jgi:hypothetical protein
VISPTARVLDRLAVLGVIGDGAASPESCEVGVALDRAAQQVGQAPFPLSGIGLGRAL